MRSKGVMLVVIGATAAMALSGCREAEQNRPLGYDKGTYLGPADDPVTTELQDQRRQRMRQYWNVGGYASLGGGTPPNVRPPEGGEPSARNRTLMQKDN